MVHSTYDELSDLANQLKNNNFKEEVVKKRYKNFFTLPLFIILMVGFLYVGLSFRSRFFSSIAWYVFMGLACLFLLIGIYTWFCYGWLIIKHWKKKNI